MAFSTWRQWLKRWFPGTDRSRRRSARRGSRPLHLEALEPRLTPTTDTWTGLGSTVNWSNKLNWATTNASGIPQAGDDLNFPSGVTKNLLNNNDLAAGTSF